MKLASYANIAKIAPANKITGHDSSSPIAIDMEMKNRDQIGGLHG